MADKRKSSKGGFLGSLINTAIVPATIFGLQQTYRRKRTGGKRAVKKTRRNKISKRKH
jgi:hypothetical protein